MAWLRVAGIQMVVDHELSANLPRILAAIAWAGEQGAQFCLFPEAALSGYHGDFDQAEVERALDGVAQACARHQVTALVGTGMRANGHATIQTRIYSEQGAFLGAHAKLVPTSGDRTWCEPGDALRTFTHRGVTLGVLICNDLWVTPGCGPYPDPRLCYQLGQAGAQVVFHAIHSGGAQEYLHYHEANLELRARESGFYIVTANAAVQQGMVNCTSGVVGPRGHWLLRTPRGGETRFVYDLPVGGE